jgi:hypothetical protein
MMDTQQMFERLLATMKTNQEDHRAGDREASIKDFQRDAEN